MPAIDAELHLRRAGIAIALLILVPLATFAPVLRHGFVDWDDRQQIHQNPDFNPPTLAKLAHYWTGPHMNLYLPVTYTAWGAIAAIAQRSTTDAWGSRLDARYFHLANLLAHLASTLLVYAILRTLGLAIWPAAAGAAVFAVHPVMVEPVAWASALYTVLSGALSLAAIWQYLVYARRDAAGCRSARTWRPLIIATIAFVLAMLTKPSSVVVPAIAAVLDWMILRRPIRRILPPLLLWIVLALPVMVIANHFQPAQIVPDVPLADRPLIAADALAWYVGRLLLPIHYAADYGRSPQWLLHSPQRYWTWLVPLLLLLAGWISRRRAPWVLAAMLVLVAGLGTYLGLIKFDFQYFSTVADRYLYVSMLAVAMAVAYVLDRWRSWILFTAAGAVVIALAIKSFMLTGIWRDSRTLFSATLATNPHSIVAHNVLGYLDAGRQDYPGAVSHYRAALATWPAEISAHYNLANALLKLGQVDQAIEQYRQTIALQPSNAQAHNNLAAALARTGQYAQAERQYEQALRLAPDLEVAQQGLMRVRQHQRQPAPTQP